MKAAFRASVSAPFIMVAVLVHVAQVAMVGMEDDGEKPCLVAQIVLTFPCQTYPSVSPVTGH